MNLQQNKEEKEHKAHSLKLTLVVFMRVLLDSEKKVNTL